MTIVSMTLHSFGLASLQPTYEESPNVLGGKGAGLVYLSSIGVPVPPGFIIPTSACNDYFKSPSAVMLAIKEQIQPYLAALKKHFGYMPLLSVRSGARKSMPGMMDTILNVGLDQNVVTEWRKRLGDACVTDSRRRLIEMYGSVVCGIDRKLFHGLDAKQCRDVFTAKMGCPFPEADIQLMNSIEAVFKSWNNERAKIYRKLNSIPDEWGTAVTVQAMVFGNMNDKSGTGVLFTRNPDTGEDVVTGEFLPKAQGEDVVAGSSTPLPLTKMHSWNQPVLAALLDTVKKLETAKGDVQDVEFTIENGKLYILQTRTAKRSARAAIRIAMEMYKAGILAVSDVVNRVSFREYLLAASPTVDPAFKTPPEFTGLSACSGVVTGKVVYNKASALECKEPCVLVSEDTTPDDIGAMLAASAVLTMTGGATSHAAVVARALNKPTVVGLGAKVSDFPEGSIVSICGSSGRVWKEAVPVVTAKPPHVTKLEALLVAHFYLKPSTIVHTHDTWNKVTEEILGATGRVVVDVRPVNEKAVTAYNAMFGKAESTQKVDAAALKHVKAKFDVLASEPLPGAILVSTDFKALVDATGPVVCDLSLLEPWQQKVLGWKEKAGEGSMTTLGYSPAMKNGIYSLPEALAFILGGAK